MSVLQHEGLLEIPKGKNFSEAKIFNRDYGSELVFKGWGRVWIFSGNMHFLTQLQCVGMICFVIIFCGCWSSSCSAHCGPMSN